MAAGSCAPDLCRRRSRSQRSRGRTERSARVCPSGQFRRRHATRVESSLGLQAHSSLGPHLDLATQSEAASALAEVDDWSWHVEIPLLIDADAVRLAQTQEVSDPARLNEILTFTELPASGPIAAATRTASTAGTTTTNSPSGTRTGASPSGCTGTPRMRSGSSTAPRTSGPSRRPIPTSPVCTRAEMTPSRSTATSKTPSGSDAPIASATPANTSTFRLRTHGQRPRPPSPPATPHPARRIARLERTPPNSPAPISARPNEARSATCGAARAVKSRKVQAQLRPSARAVGFLPSILQPPPS